MRLTLVIHSLNCGGAERVMSIMANYWAARGWGITLLTFDDGSTSPFYEFDHRVRHTALALEGSSRTPLDGLGRNLKRLSVLRRALVRSNPAVVISFMDKTNVMALLATRGTKLPVIVSERSDPCENSPGRVWALLRRWSYPLASVVVVQTPSALNYFSRTVRSRTCVIPNPVLPPLPDDSEPSLPFPRPLAVAMGRLVPEKGFDLLLRAFARISETHREWTLAIVGEGPMRSDLEHLRDELRLEGRVHLPGRVKGPQSLLRQADLFVMSSRFEGFPNALCEAMSEGLAVISTDCPSGPRAIIRDGIDGLLIPNGDAAALASAMDRLMADEGERKRLGLLGTHVSERFALKKVMGMWEEALRLAGDEGRTRSQAGEAVIARAR